MNARNQKVSHPPYVSNSKPPARKVLPISLQHIMAMFLGTVTVPVVIAGAADADAAIRTTMTQYPLTTFVLATMTQVCPLGPVGPRLPVIFCVGPTCVPAFTPITAQYGLPGVFGTQLLRSVITIALGFRVGRLHKFFPTVVIGIVILSIGLSLYPIALKYMVGNASPPTYGQLNNRIAASVILAVVLFFNLTYKGVVKMASILLGAVVGYVLALCMGMVRLDGVVGASWLTVPKLLLYGMPPLGLSMVPSILLTTIVNIVQSVGDVTGTTIGGFDREPRSKELTGGVAASGIATLVGTIFGVPVVSSSSQNVGIVPINKVMSRRVITIAYIIMLALGTAPKLNVLVPILPVPVIDDGTLIVSGIITLTRLKLVSGEPLTARNSTIVGVSITLAMGLSTLEGTAALGNFPPLAQALLSKPVVAAGVMSFLLNLLAPGKTVGEEARERTALDAGQSDAALST